MADFLKGNCQLDFWKDHSRKGYPIVQRFLSFVLEKHRHYKMNLYQFTEHCDLFKRV